MGSLALLALAATSATTARAGAPTAAGNTATTVQGLVVTAERPPAQTLLDRKVYTISNDLQTTSGVAADVLNNIPSVAVDADGNVSLRGDSNVTILVDGKPSAQFAGATRGLSLQQFAASDIERIEVLTNPPAQFKAEGSGGVINIVTKKTRAQGVSGGAQLNVGDKRRIVAGLNGAYNSGPLKLSGALGLRQDTRLRGTTSSRLAIDPASGAAVASQQAIDEQQRRLIPSVKASLDYQLNERQSLGASYSDRDLTGNRYFDQHDVSGPAAASATSISNRHSDGHEWNAANSAGLHFDQKLWRPDETLSLSLQRSVERERERYAYTNSFTLPVAAPTFDDLRLSLDLVKTEFSADYDLPMSHDRELRLGYGLEDDRNAFDNVGDIRDPATGQPVGNPSVTNHFRYRQRINAAYAQYEAPLGAWKLQAGLRLETTDVSFLQITGNIPGGRHDFGAYPSLHLDRAVGDDGKLSLSVGRRVNRPDPEQLNPFIDFQDVHNLRAGNANLLPQDTWSYELGYNTTVAAVTYGATAYYRFDRNAVTDILRPLSGDVVLATKANLPKSRSEGVEFSANGKLGRELSYAVSGDLFHAQIDAGPLGGAGLRSTTGVNLKASLDYRPTSADTAQVSVARTDKRLTPQGEIGAINLVNLGYRRQLRPDLAMVVTVSDLFDGQRFRRLVSTPVLRDDYVRLQFGRIGYVGLVYTLGGGAKAKANNFEYDQ